MKRTKSELRHYAVSIKFSIALQMIGVGGQHASTSAAFLDLPSPTNGLVILQP
jgi:hypothetical protein